MKSFIFALCAFALLVAVIVVNCVFILHTANSMEQLLTEVAQAEDPIAPAEQARDYWQAREGALAISVPYNKLYEVKDRLCELCVAAQGKDASELEVARLSALHLLDEIRRTAHFSWRSLF